MSSHRTARPRDTALYDSTIYRLLVFRTVVEEGSFRRAGDRLGITQPAVSAHVTALENTVGLKLLERSAGRPATPTQAGRMVYRYALETTLNTDDLVEILGQLRDGQTGTLVMGTSSTLGKHVFPPILASFRQRYPKVNIVMRTGMKNTVVGLVSRGEAEFGVVFTVGETEGLHSEVLAEEELLLVVGRGHPLARRPRVTVEELARYDFTAGVATSQYQATIRKLLASIGLQIRTVPIQLEDADAIRAFVKQGIGIAPLLRCTVAADLKEGSLVELKLDRGPIFAEIRLLSRPGKQLFSPVAELFLRHLRRSLQSRYQRVPGSA